MNERFLIAQIIRANVIGIRQAEADDFSPRSYLEELDKLVAYLEADPEGEIVVTKNQTGQIVAVTRQDEEGRILKVIAESAAGVGVPATGPEVVANLRVYDFRDEDGGERRTDAEPTGFAGKLPPGDYELVVRPCGVKVMEAGPQTVTQAVTAAIARGVGVPKEAEPRIVECDLCALRRNADTCPVFRCPHKPAAGVGVPQAPSSRHSDQCKCDVCWNRYEGAYRPQRTAGVGVPNGH